MLFKLVLHAYEAQMRAMWVKDFLNIFIKKNWFSTLTSQLLRTDRGHKIKVALAPAPPPAPDGPLPVPTTHTKQIDSCKTLSYHYKQREEMLLMLHPPELFFALFFAGTACEEVHSRAAAKSTSSSRTAPVRERVRTKSVNTENISYKSAFQFTWEINDRK